MTDGNRSFWSSIPGLITGLAGLLTGIVGLVTVLIQLGVVGGKDKPSTAVSSVTTVTVAPGQAGSTTTLFGAATSATPTTERGRFTVNPTLLSLQSSDRQKPLTVKNASSTASITVLAPDFDGADKTAFRADAGCTNVLLQPGGSCTLNVLFTPTAILRAYNANVLVKASGADSTSVPIEVKAGL